MPHRFFLFMVKGRSDLLLPHSYDFFKNFGKTIDFFIKKCYNIYVKNKKIIKIFINKGGSDKYEKRLYYN